MARQAADNDVHVVGVSSLAAGHLTLVPALRDALAEVGRPDIMIVVGGVIPPGDFDELYAAGAAAICSAISRTVVSRSSAGTTRDTIPWARASSALGATFLALGYCLSAWARRPS